MELKDVNQIVSVGSADGVLTTAALLRYLMTFKDQEMISLDFCQAFTVDEIDEFEIKNWKPNRNVAFVDLAVNNRDPQMTADFVRRIQKAGHKIVAIIDEHSSSDWMSVLGAGKFFSLAVKPRDRNDYIKSSGSVLRHALNSSSFTDPHLFDLLKAADEADCGDFSSPLASIVNSAVKSAINDDSRRAYLARHLSQHATGDELIQRWIGEYEDILLNHSWITEDRTNPAEGFVRVVTTGKRVDMTSLMFQLYELDNCKIVVVQGELYDKQLGRKTVQIAFGTKLKLDLLAALKAANIECSGFASKANVSPKDEDAAIDVLKQLIA